MGKRREAPRKHSKNPKAEKICPVCERPFHWRARWKNNWPEVIYCSRRCAGQRGDRVRADAPEKQTPQAEPMTPERDLV